MRRTPNPELFDVKFIAEIPHWNEAIARLFKHSPEQICSPFAEAAEILKKVLNQNQAPHQELTKRGPS